MRKALVWGVGEKICSADEEVTEVALPQSPSPLHLDHSFFLTSSPPHYRTLHPPNSLIFKLKGKFSSLRISLYVLHSSQTLHGVPRHTQASHSLLPLRSTLNSHGLSILQESGDRILQNQTNSYCCQVLVISSWRPGALPSRALTSTEPCSPTPQLPAPRGHQRFPSLAPHQSGVHLPPPFPTELKVHFLLGDSKVWIRTCLEGSLGKGKNRCTAALPTLRQRWVLEPKTWAPQQRRANLPA